MGEHEMKLKDVLAAITSEDIDDIEEAVNMEVEFNTINRGNMHLLSVYENDGKIHIDIGTDEDSEEHNRNFLEDS